MIELNKFDDEEEIERTLMKNAYFNGKNMNKITKWYNLDFRAGVVWLNNIYLFKGDFLTKVKFFLISIYMI